MKIGKTWSNKSPEPIAAKRLGFLMVLLSFMFALGLESRRFRAAMAQLPSEVIRQ
jgi:hypothetical protein